MYMNLSRKIKGFSLIEIFIPHSNCRHKVAFTLAEVLITLGIIGVVAAITMPMITAHYKKQETVTQLKKIYSELAQAIEASKLDNGDISQWNFSLSVYDFFYEYLAPYMKVVTSKSIYHVKEDYNIKYYRLNGIEETNYNPVGGSSRNIHFPSGAQLLCSITAPSSSGYIKKTFVVDINGFKKPNKFGRDLFVFELYTSGQFIGAIGDDREDYTPKTRDVLLNGPSTNLYNCSKNARGMWCAAVIMMDNWQIKEDYPW